MQVMCTSTFDTEGSHEVLLKSGKPPPQKLGWTILASTYREPLLFFFFGGGGGGELSYFWSGGV